MGLASSKIRNIRRSFRRMSLSKSIENLRKGQKDTKLRHSKSLTNLVMRKKDINSSDEVEKNLRRSSVIISPANLDNVSKSESDVENKENEVIQKNQQRNGTVSIKKDSLNETQKGDLKPNQNVVEKLVGSVNDCKSVIALKSIDSRLKEMENQIDQMSHEDLFVYHSTFKDEIHNFWIKAYEIKESNDKVKPKKIETIEYVKKLLHKLNQKMFQRNIATDSFC